MAAVEIPNVLHAMGAFFLGTSQAFTVEVRKNGFIEGSLVRQAEGIFTVGLVEKLDAATSGGLCHVTPAAGTPRFVSAQLQPVIPGEPNNNVLITCHDNAGDLADIGEVVITVWRFPNG